MKNILVTGGNGQLGSELNYFSQTDKSLTADCQFFFTDVADLDITDKAAISDFCKHNKITHIINCAAHTAVDKAESEPELADKINHLAVLYIAEIAKQNDIAVVHVSTDYVFDGCGYKPYVETDTPDPQNVYGKTKLDGELALLQANPKNSIIIRTSWVYSSWGNNFVKTMLRLGAERDELGVIFDQIGTPTYARDLAKAILQILPQLDNTHVETFHFSNEGVCSWYDFARDIFAQSGMSVNVKPIETKEYPTPAARPHYSLMNKAKIKAHYNIHIRAWNEALTECLAELSSSWLYPFMRAQLELI